MTDPPEEASKRTALSTGRENPPNEISDAERSETNVPTQETNPMEVHHHAHHDRKGGWKSYFWEFLMLFLAVFCGFLAEYKLEHVIEHNREKKLMRTLTDDLTSDKETLQTYIVWRKEVNSDFDSLLLLLSDPEPEKSAFLIYKLINRSALRFGLPDLNGGTISQLTYAGGLRLVRSKAVLEAINKHYLEMNRMKATFEIEQTLRLNIVSTQSAILDAKLLLNANPDPKAYSLVSTEPNVINHFMHEIIAARRINNRLANQLDSLSSSTDKLRELVVNEYQFH